MRLCRLSRSNGYRAATKSLPYTASARSRVWRFLHESVCPIGPLQTETQWSVESSVEVGQAMPLDVCPCRNLVDSRQVYSSIDCRGIERFQVQLDGKAGSHIHWRNAVVVLEKAAGGFREIIRGSPNHRVRYFNPPCLTQPITTLCRVGCRHVPILLRLSFCDGLFV